jgi:hypothetical protein
MKEVRNAYNILIGIPGWKRSFEDLGGNGKIILQ